MQHTKVQIGDKSLLPEIEKRVLLPEVDGQVGQVLAKGPDGTTSWIDGGGLPSGAKDGDIPIKSAAVVGTNYNDDHTVLFLQNGVSNTAASDTPLPVAWGTAPATQEDGSLLLTGSNQLATTSNSAVASVFGGEFTVEAYLKPTQFNNTSRQDTNFFYLNGPSTYYIYLSNYADGGSAQNGKFGLWAYSGSRQIICNNNEYTHVAIDVYKEGTSRKYTIYYNGVPAMSGDWYNDGVEGSSNAVIRFFSSSDGDNLNNCYLKSFRVSNIARYKGVTFTPPTGGTYLPAPDGEWITINKSQLVAQDDVKLNPDPVKVPAGKYGFSPALRNVDLVNGDTTKLYINPNLSGKEIKDIAAGTSTPHTFVNHNVTVSESTGAMVFDGSSSYLEIDPSDIITEGQEWCLDLYLKTTRYNSKIMNIRTWTDSGQEFSIWIRSSGEISVHSSPLGTGVVGKAIPLNEEFRFTLEQYIENSVWKLAMYVNGEHFGTVDAELHRYHSNTVLGKGYNDPWMSGEISRVIWRTEAPYKGTNFTDEAATELSYVMPNKVSDVPAGSTVQLNNNGTPVYVEAEKVLLNDAKNVKLNQLDPTRQLPATTTNSVTPVYKKQDVIGAMYNDSKVVVLLQGSKTNTAKNAAFQLTGGDEVTVDSDGNLVFNCGNGIIVPADKFNNEANGQFTVDIMIAVDELPTSNSYEYIFGNDNSPTYPFNYRVHSDGTVRFQYQNTNHNIQIEKGIFALLSFDYDGTTLRSYKDGVLVGAQDITYSAFPNTIGIGTDQYYQHTGFAGRIKYIRMSNIARYRGLAFTPPGLAGYITPPDGEWVTTPAIGDNRLLPNNPTNGDIPVYTNDFDKSNFNTTDTVCLLQNAGANQFENVAKGKIGGSRINNYAGSVTIDENGYFVYPGGSGTWIEFIASGWNASGNGSWTIDVRMIAEATGSSQYFLGPANDGSGDPQAVIRGSGPTGTIQPYELSDMIHDITFGEEFTYTMAWDAPTKTLRTWKDGKQMRKRTFTSNGYQFGFKGATEFWLGRNAVDPGLKGKVKYWRLSNAALYGDSEFTPPTDVYQDAPDGAWELINKGALADTLVDEARLLPDPANYTPQNNGWKVGLEILGVEDREDFLCLYPLNEIVSGLPVDLTNKTTAVDQGQALELVDDAGAFEGKAVRRAATRNSSVSNKLVIPMPKITGPFTVDIRFKAGSSSVGVGGSGTNYAISGTAVSTPAGNLAYHCGNVSPFHAVSFHALGWSNDDHKLYWPADDIVEQGWYWIRFTRSATAVHVFMNGKLLNSTTNSGAMNTIPAGNWTILPDSEDSNVLLDEVRITNTCESIADYQVPEKSAGGIQRAYKLYKDEAGISDLSDYNSATDQKVSIKFNSSESGEAAQLVMKDSGAELRSGIRTDVIGGSCALSMADSFGIMLTGGSIALQTTEKITLNAQDGIYLGEAAPNAANGLLVIGADGKIPALDGSKLTNLPAATVDLGNYSADSIKLTGTTKIELNAGTGTALQIATESGDAFRTTFKTSGLWSADIAGYLTTIHGGMQMDIYADSSQADVRIYAGGSPSSSSGNGNILLYGSDIKFNGNALNSANGLVKAEAGKLPALDGSNLTNLPGGSVDLSSYTGKINLTSANDQTVSIKFNSGNPTYNAVFTMDTTGIDLIGYGTITVGYRNGGYVQFTSGMTTLFSMSSLAINAGSRITLSATEGIYLGAAGMNTAGGLAKINTDGKLPASIIPDVSTAAPKRAYIPIPKGDNGATITEMFVELKFTDTKNFESGAVDVNMTNAAAAMFGVTSVAKDNGSVVPSLVQMTEAGVPVEFFETYLLLDIDYLGSAGLNLLDDSKTYIAAYRWRATLEDDTTNTPWRLLSF